MVELAKSGRSTCKKSVILKGTLRVGTKVYRDQDDRERKNYYHPACWPVPRKLTSIEEVRGFASLTQEQREVLELRFRQPRAVGGKKGKAPAEVQAQAPPAPRTGQGYNGASEAEARVGRPRPSSVPDIYLVNRCEPSPT